MNHDFVKFSDLYKQPLINGINRPTKDRDCGYKMVNMREKFAHDRIYNVEMEQVLVSEKEKHYFLEKGDLIFARQSLVLSGAGKCSIFMGASEPTTFEGHIIRVRLNKAIVVTLYYYYYFNSKEGRSNIETIIEQVSAAGIRGSDLSNLVVPNPPLKTPKKFAHNLGILDDKIELNRKMNKTLEEIAQPLFKHWFIDFEFPNAEGKPYKSSGGEMIDSELGLIPKGCRVGKLGDEFNITMGQYPPGNTYNQTGDGLPFYQGNADFVFRYPNNRIYCTAPKRIARAGDTLISVRAPVGDINLAKEICIIGRGVACIHHKSDLRSYTYYLMEHKATCFKEFESNGTVFECISKQAVGCITYIRPTLVAKLVFNSIVSYHDYMIEIFSNVISELRYVKNFPLKEIL